MTGLTVLNVVRSVGLTHQLVNLVRQERAVHGRYFQDAAVITSTDVLQEWMAAFLVEGQQGWLVHFQHLTYGRDIGLGLNGEFANFIDNDDLRFFPGSSKGRDGDALQFRKVEAKTEHPEPVIVASVSDDALLAADNVDDLVALAFASFEDRLHAEAGDDEGVWITAAHAQFTHTLVHDHVEDFAHDR